MKLHPQAAEPKIDPQSNPSGSRMTWFDASMRLLLEGDISRIKPRRVIRRQEDADRQP